MRFYTDFVTKTDKLRDEAVARCLKTGISTGLAFGLIYVIMGVEIFYGLYLASVGAFGGNDPTKIGPDGCRDTSSDFTDKVMVPIISLQVAAIECACTFTRCLYGDRDPHPRTHCHLP